ncbi:uracil-xanthine permease family protein [Facklamia sp. P13064]|uniref:uracil-xanthine permease family protein n=1 Tax=unclassified Facklamia TaxID=2622293 RepID=UPI003D16657F
MPSYKEIKMENSKDKMTLLLQPHEKPEFTKGLLLSFQHVFAMFGATILVPLILGLSVSTALLASGIGTLIYLTITKGEVPVYLGSSFAYIAAMALAMEQLGGDVSAAQTGIMMVGLFYVVIAGVIKYTGTDWLNKILPPIVIGPMIIVIGLGLASSAVNNAGFVSGGDWRNIFVSVGTLLISVYMQIFGKGFFKVIPFLIAIIGGYLLSLMVGIVDYTPVIEASWIRLPDLSLPFATPVANWQQYKFYFGPEAWAILPIALVTIAEHTGDHVVLSEICDRNFLSKPGLHRTLAGDGLATFVSALIGGPANTTYGENSGVIALTRIASVSVIRNAAFLAILISFFGKFNALVASIPSAVLGGMSILLYGVIASNGLKVLIKDHTDFSQSRNLIIASAMLVIGLGGAVLDLGGSFVVSGTALSALVGITLNAMLPELK